MRIAGIVAVMVLVASVAAAGQTGTRAMAGWSNVTTPDGWVGKRYMDGNEIFAEEFDSNGDNRIDIWRFYRRGVLSSEERDLRGDGKVNYQSRWEPRTFRLVSVFRDTRWAGVNDLEIEAVSRNRWELREDRNRDGVADRILIVTGPANLFELLGMDLAHQEGVIDSIPQAYWYELQSDDDYTCAITDYRRYAGGVMTHYGQWDGQKVVWRRGSPDYVPPSAPPPQLVATPITDERVPVAAVPPSDPYMSEAYSDPVSTGVDPYTDPFADPYAAGEPDIHAAPSGQFRGPTDRTRYEGLPPGESAARSLPARMRPPGVSRR